MNEKLLTPFNGFLALFLNTAFLLACVVSFGLSIFLASNSTITTAIAVSICVVSVILFILSCILYAGLKVLGPNEALVLTLFGKYHGTIISEGFYYVNPFCEAVNPMKKSSLEEQQTLLMAAQGKKSEEKKAVDHSAGKRISMKSITLNNRKQKVNDMAGNPIEIGAMVIWKVRSPAMAVFSVDNYVEFVSIQADATLRNVVRMFPYDLGDTQQGMTLRSGSNEVADILKQQLQEKVAEAGLDIVEVKITDLAYAPEIAVAMLQRQQASAMLDARKLIVEGAVGMVRMALDQLQSEDIVHLDDERKAAMVSNLLVVLCGNRDTQPIINSGSLY